MILAVAAATYFCDMQGLSPAGNSPRLRPHVEDQELQNAPIISIIDDDESMRCAIKRLVTSLGLDAYTFALDEHFPFVNGDRVQLQQVLVNLITNAIDAMAEKKWPRILRIKSAVQEPGGVLISVADTGKGIDPKIVDRIFNPLFTTKSNGMGMGLSICRSIIEGHDGRLWASAGAEGGSAFQFVLPATSPARANS